jgi:hypothetical protein
MAEGGNIVLTNMMMKTFGTHMQGRREDIEPSITFVQRELDHTLSSKQNNKSMKSE